MMIIKNEGEGGEVKGILGMGWGGLTREKMTKVNIYLWLVLKEKGAFVLLQQC